MSTLSASVLLNRLLAKGRLRHIQVLVKLTELGSAKRTADALHISQPAVTQLLADLERLAEMPLFERHVRGLRPTAAGAALAPLARRILDTVAEGSDTLVAMKNDGEGVVRLAAITGVISGLLTRALPPFACEHPGIQVHVTETDVDAWAKLVAQGSVDLVGCRQPKVVPQGWKFRPLLPDRFVVVCGPQHRLARRRRVRLSSLAGETWLPAPLPSAAREAFDRLAHDSPAPVKTCQIITRVSSLTSAMLRARPLLSIVPFSVVRQLVFDGQLVALDIEGESPFDALGLLVPERELTVAAGSLVTFLEGFAAANP
ncbi:MAG: LysR family transcriptional regulator [Burkholderiales bacterium]|nr:LysR family transcriptional regulator [Burkholderiales bacterium]